MKKSILLLLLLFLLSILAAETVEIGILATEGKAECIERWRGLAKYLNDRLPQYEFQIIPIDYASVEKIAKTKNVDFLLINPYYYVLMEEKYQATRLATVETNIKGKPYNEYAGVIFCRADNQQINSLTDIKGKSFSAVSPQSFGGYLITRYLFSKFKINTSKDLKISFAGSHRAVVYEVMSGKSEAGSVRSGVLERMAADKLVDLDDIKIISEEKDCSDFPLLHSTCLFPEWPLAKLQHTSKDIAKQVTIELFEMSSESAAAKQAGIWGWTFPSNYQPVHQVLQNLQIAPYEKQDISILNLIIQQHLAEAIVIIIFIIAVAFLVVKLLSIRTKQKLETAVVEQVRNDLQSSQANLQALIESTDDVIVSFDREGKLLTFNNKFAEVVKKSSGLDIKPGMDLLKITPPDQKKFWESVYKRALNGNRFSEVMAYHKDSANPHYYHITFNPIIEDGKVVGFTEFSRDLSELKKTENELRKMYMAVEQGANAIIITDTEGKIEFVNPKFCELTGYSREEVIGKNPNILKSGNQDRNFYQNMWDTIKAGKNWHGELLNKKKNGEFYWEWATIAPIKNEDGEIINFIAINEDITKRKQAQQELQEANQKLRELSANLEEKVDKAVAEIQEKEHMLIAQSRQAAMGEMIANIAHQWRQPLSAVAAIVQDIEDAYEFDELDTEYLENSVKKTMEQIQYMSQTIDDFRNFFNPNKSKQKFNIREKIEKILTFLNSSVKQYNIKIDLEIDENCTCHGYPNEFSQVVLNILNNAKDAIKENKPENPFIKISCKVNSEGKNIIKISNNGGKIPEDKIEKIFQPYFTTKKDGTGLGLYMSKMIVERNLKGRIELQNIENGVEFKIEI